MTLAVRDVCVGDAEGVKNILNPIVEEGRFTVLDKTFSLDEERAFIANFPERGVFKVALSDEPSVIVGFQNVEPFASYTSAFDHVGIIATFVDSQFRRQGIAKKLFEASYLTAKSLGYEKLFAYVRADNPRALSVYSGQGFNVIGTAKNHAKIKGVFIDEVLIEKFLK